MTDYPELPKVRYLQRRKQIQTTSNDQSLSMYNLSKNQKTSMTLKSIAMKTSLPKIVKDSQTSKKQCLEKRLSVPVLN